MHTTEILLKLLKTKPGWYLKKESIVYGKLDGCVYPNKRWQNRFVVDSSHVQTCYTYDEQNQQLDIVLV